MPIADCCVTGGIFANDSPQQLRRFFAVTHTSLRLREENLRTMPQKCRGARSEESAGRAVRFCVWIILEMPRLFLGHVGSSGCAIGALRDAEGAKANGAKQFGSAMAGVA